MTDKVSVLMMKLGFYPTKQLDFSPSRPATILIPSMGAKEMPDFEQIEASLLCKGTNVLSVDFSESGSMRRLDWNNIDIVDLSNMRGCLTSYDRYLGILDRMYDYIHQQEENGHKITVTPKYDAIEWIASKANYIDYLNNQQIQTIPTQILCKLKEPESASIISQPDNFDTLFSEMQEFFETSNTNHFVLKPSTSSLSRGLIFIDQVPENGSFVVALPMEEGEPNKSCYKSFDDLKSYLVPYLTNIPSPDHCFLLQEYVPNIETSAVFVNGTPHFVKRLQGEQSHIAHARYGGVDQIDPNPERDLVNFVYSVMQALPTNIQNSCFLRIDVMKDLENDKYILSEIEGAGAARLWLKEAKRTDDYTRMLIDEASLGNSTRQNLKPTDMSFESKNNTLVA